MSLFNKKSKDKVTEPLRPQDVFGDADSLRDKKDRGVIGKLMMRRAGESATLSHVMIKAVAMILASLLALMAIVCFVGWVITSSGSFTISTKLVTHFDNKITLSATEDFSDAGDLIKVPPISRLDNTTLDFLPDDIDMTDGEHNGEDYIAVTFYVRNTGLDTVDYEGKIQMVAASKGIDEALRVMVYKNGERTIYAKAQKNSDGEAEPGCVNFESDMIIMTTGGDDFEVGATDKYTVVMWLEGNDPECVNDILGGNFRAKMDFELLGDNAAED